MKNANDPITLENLSVEKSNLVREIVSVLSANEWEKDKIAGISTSQDTIDRAKSLITTLDKIQELSKKTNNPMLKQGLKKGYTITLNDIVSTLTVWFESSEKTTLPPAVQQELPKETTQPLIQENPTLAKDLSIANHGQIIMHNNIYKVNLVLWVNLKAICFLVYSIA